MVRAPGKLLIFTLADIRYVVDLDHVVEILEQFSERLDARRNDLRQGIVGAVAFRHTTIPLIDPTLILGLVSTVDISLRSALVLRGSEGNWALLVDRVAGLAPADHFRRAVIPVLLQLAPGFARTEVVLAEDVPLMVFEPERFYGINRARQ